MTDYEVNANIRIDGTLDVKKPHADDAENIHGEDFYTITPLKTLGFGCIMYTPHNYQPLEQKIIFTYSSILKPLTNKLFDVFLALLFIIFIKQYFNIFIKVLFYIAKARGRYGMNSPFL